MIVTTFDLFLMLLPFFVLLLCQVGLLAYLMKRNRP